jgi:hypothetical protein
VVGEVAHAGVLAGPDPVIDPGAAAVTQLQVNDVLVRLVGEKAGVAVAVLFEDRELRAGIRTLAAADQPGPLTPRCEVEVRVSVLPCKLIMSV